MHTARQTKFISEILALPEKAELHLRYEADGDDMKVLDEGKYSLVSRVICEDLTMMESDTNDVVAFLILESASGKRNRVLEIDDYGNVEVHRDADADPSSLAELLRTPIESIPEEEVCSLKVIDFRGEKSDLFPMGGHTYQIFVNSGVDSHYLVYVPKTPAGEGGAKPYRALSYVGSTDAEFEDEHISINGRPLPTFFTFDFEEASAEAKSGESSKTIGSASPFPSLNAKAFEAPASGGNSTKVLVFLILALILGALVYLKV